MTNPLPGPIAPRPSAAVAPAPMSAPASAAAFDDDGFDAAPRKKVSAALIWRALRRHWWQALALWLVASAALMVLAYARVKPTFSAISQVRVEPAEQGLFHESGPSGTFQEKIETEVVAVTSPPVLAEAVAAHPDIANLPRLRGTLDVDAEIRQALQVRIVPKTHLIQVEMASTSPVEAANIVNAVVQAYLKYASTIDNKETNQRIAHLEETRDERMKELKAKRDELNRLSEKIGSANAETVSKYNSVTVDQYRSFTEQLTQVEIQRFAAQAKLGQLQAERDATARPPDDREVMLAVRDAFYTDPRVAALQVQRERLEAHLERVGRVARVGNDPALVNLRAQLDRVSARIDDLWGAMAPRLRAQLSKSTGQEGVEQSVRETQALLAALQGQERAVRDKLDRMNIESKGAGGDALRLEYAQHDVQRAAEVLHKAEDLLYQLKYEIRAPKAKVHLEFPARPSNRPSTENRLKIMAVAPIAVACAVLGLLVALEAGAGRVADPDELTSRARLQVLGVVPPLPMLRPASAAGLLTARDEARTQRQLDEFVQSLDHLRVALCARPDPWGRDRHCVLITSACGSEGKTTLAAQLAERCVNAGLMTLLIDADLRNPTLSRMLDATEQPGLINVLRGASTPEDAMIVVRDAGGFHFLPSGTPRLDPSRLLQGEALGTLLAQARESFDMIIVDAPPVLPVPDALTIGRWTDGAVLAVRYDTSRFSLVERAQRRLAHVGVSVLGAVVNGVRTAEMYGYYSGAYGVGAAEGDGVAPEEEVLGA